MRYRRHVQFALAVWLASSASQVFAMKALLHRSVLRGHSLKIEAGRISIEELRDYVEKGGEVDFLKTYDTWRDLNVGTNDAALLNRFIGTGEDRLEKIALLLRHKADPNRGKRSLTPVQTAAKLDDLEALKLLVASGGDVNFAVPGQTALEPHIEHPPLSLANDPKVIRYLIEHGANVLFKNKEGGSLLHMAANAGRTMLVAALIEQGVSPSDKDGYGRTPRDVAETAVKALRARLKPGEPDGERVEEYLGIAALLKQVEDSGGRHAPPPTGNSSDRP